MSPRPNAWDLPDDALYGPFAALHAQSILPWRAALEEVRARHALPVGDFTRFVLGKNAVFAVGDAVVKVMPLLSHPDEWEGVLSDLGVSGAQDWAEVGAALFGPT